MAVLAVQVGFQIYSAIGRTEFAYRSIGIAPPATAGARDGWGQDDIDQLYASSMRPAEFDETETRPSRALIAGRPARSTTYTVQPAVQRAPARRVPFTPPVIAKNIVITIPKPAASAYASDAAPRYALVKPEKKRSFFSKSLHVLKKPYDLIKTVAMKLN